MSGLSSRKGIIVCVAPDKKGKRLEYDLERATAKFWQELHSVPVVTEQRLDKHVMNIYSCLIYERGSEAGCVDAALAVLVPQLEKRFGRLSQNAQKKMRKLSVEELATLGQDLLDFQSSKDLHSWFR